jgi:hypothetical protein
MKTRLPRKSRSLIVSLSIYAPVQNIAMALFRARAQYFAPFSRRSVSLSMHIPRHM